MLDNTPERRNNQLPLTLDHAQRLRETGQHDEAERLYEMVQASEPQNIAALLGLASIARIRGQHERALSYFSAAREADADNLWIVIECANEQRALGMPDLARALYEEVLERDPAYAAAHSGLGTLARSAGNREAALSHFNAARAATPSNPWTLIECATELRALQRFAEADALCRDILAEAPSYAAAHHGLGVSARQAGEHERALQHFADARRVEPANLWNAIECITEMRALGRLDEAAGLCGEILEAAPDYVAAHGALGHIERQRGRHRKALAHFERAATHGPQDVWLQIECVTELRALGELEDAARRLEELGALRPDMAAVDHGLGMIARQKQEHAAALAHFEEASRKEPHNLWNRLECAAELRSLGRFEDASHIYEAARQQDPGNAHILIGLGITARMRGQHEAAAEHFRQAVSIQPDNPYFRGEYGHELTNLNRLDEAQSQFDAACELPGGGVPGRRGLATLARLRSDGEAELRQWRALGESQPNDAHIKVQYIQRFSAIRGPRETLGHFFAQTEPDQSELELTIEYAVNLRLAGRISEAMQVIAKLAPTVCGNPHLIVHLATEARLGEDFDLCRTLLGGIFAQGSPSAAAYLEKARLDRRLGSVEVALESYRAAIARQPQGIDALAECLGYLREKFRFEEAVKAARAANISAHSPARLFGQLIGILCDLEAIDEAKKLVEERKALFPDRLETLIYEADIALAEGVIDMAFSRVRRVIKQSPRHQEAWSRLAYYAALADDYAFALQALEQHAEPRPELEATRSYYQSQLGMQDQALATLGAACARYGEIPVLVMAQCRILERIGLIDEARLLLAAACRDYPANADLLIYRATLSYRTGGDVDYQELSQNPAMSEPQKQLLLGRAAMRRRDTDQAITHFETAVSGVDSPDLRRDIALMRMFKLDFEASRSDLAQAMRMERRARQAKQQSMNASQSLYGQFLDEYRLDTQTALKIRAVLETVPLMDPEPLLEIARANPDSTLAAVMTLLRLRQSGMLDTEGKMGGGQMIPQRICQFWADGEPPSELRPYMESWVAFNPGYEYRLFDTRDAEAFLEAHAPDADTLAAFRLAREPAVKADILRLAYLYQGGGFYADIDDRCVKSLEHIRSSAASFCGYQEDVGSLANNVLGAIPAHPVIGQALRKAIEAVLRGDGDMPWLSTGPGLLSRAFVQWLATDGGTLADKLSTIFVPDYPASFEYFSIHCFASYKITPQHWGRRIFG